MFIIGVIIGAVITGIITFLIQCDRNCGYFVMNPITDEDDIDLQTVGFKFTKSIADKKVIILHKSHE